MNEVQLPTKKPVVQTGDAHPREKVKSYQDYGDQVVDTYCGTTVRAHHRVHHNADGSEVSTYKTFNAKGQPVCQSVLQLHRDGSADRIDRRHNKVRHLTRQADGMEMGKISDLDKKGAVQHYSQYWTTPFDTRSALVTWQRGCDGQGAISHRREGNHHKTDDYITRNAQGQVVAKARQTTHDGTVVQTWHAIWRAERWQEVTTDAAGRRHYSIVSPDREEVHVDEP